MGIRAMTADGETPQESRLNLIAIGFCYFFALKWNSSVTAE